MGGDTKEGFKVTLTIKTPAMKKMITLITLWFTVLFSFGQGKLNHIHEKSGKIHAETKLTGCHTVGDKIKQARPIQESRDLYQKTWLKSDQTIKQGIDSLIIQFWDESTSQWKIVYKEEFTYDANGNMTQSVPYMDEGGGQLAADWKSEYTFNANGDKTQRFSYEWDESTSQWVLSGKEEYTYDANGNMTQSDGFGWDESGSKWLVGGKSEYTYDANGNMTQSIESYWDGLSWVTQYKHDYTYNLNGGMTQSSGYRWDESTSDWVPIDKLEYTYDNGNIAQSLYYCWDEDASAFVDCWKEEYTRDAEGNIIQNHQYEWDEGTEYLMGKYEYSYDNLYARSDMILPIFNDDFSIIEALDITHLFNHKLDNFQGSAWDEGSGEWILYLKGDYYYSEHNVSSVDETGIDISKVYPNPCSEYLTFSFSGNYLQITFELFDLQGRKLMTREIKANETISLEGLENGLYVFELSTPDGNKQSGRLVKQ